MWKVLSDDHVVGHFLKGFGYWLLFSIVISLAQLWLVPCIYYLTKKPLTWAELIGNGSLLFFATTITSKTAGEYFKKSKDLGWLPTLVCIGVTFLIVMMSVSAYALVTASRMGILTLNSLSPERVATFSNILALSGAIFSFAFTLLIRGDGK